MWSSRGCKLTEEQAGRNSWNGTILSRWFSQARRHSKLRALLKLLFRYEELCSYGKNCPTQKYPSFGTSRKRHGNTILGSKFGKSLHASQSWSKKLITAHTSRLSEARSVLGPRLRRGPCKIFVRSSEFPQITRRSSHSATLTCYSNSHSPRSALSVTSSNLHMLLSAIPNQILTSGSRR
jgi:hypothetical protein